MNSKVAKGSDFSNNDIRTMENTIAEINIEVILVYPNGNIRKVKTNFNLFNAIADPASIIYE